MVQSAPSSLAFSSFSSLPAVAMTLAPKTLATWIAALPTPLPAAQTRTVSPETRCALVASMCQAVRKTRSEEHTSELQSHSDLVCRLLLEKKKPMKCKLCLRRLQLDSCDYNCT